MKRYQRFFGLLLTFALVVANPSLSRVAEAVTTYSESYMYNNPIASGTVSYTYLDGKVTYTNAKVNEKVMTLENIAGESTLTEKNQGFSEGGTLWIIYRNEGIYWFNFEILGKVGVLQKWSGLSGSEKIKATSLKNLVGGSSALVTHYTNQYGVDIPLPSWNDLYKMVNGEDFVVPTQVPAPTQAPVQTEAPMPTQAPTFTQVPATQAPTVRTFEPVPVPTFEPTVAPTQEPKIVTNAPAVTNAPTTQAPTVTQASATQAPISFPTFAPINLRTFEPVPVPSTKPEVTVVTEEKTIGEIDIWWDRFINGQITWDEYLQVKGLFNWTVDEKNQELEHTYNIYDDQGRLVEIITYRSGEKTTDGNGSYGKAEEKVGEANLKIEDQGEAKVVYEQNKQTTTNIYNNNAAVASAGAIDDYFHMRVKKNAKGNVTKLYEDGNSSKKWISQCRITKKGYLKFNSLVFKKGKVKAVTYSASGKKIIVLMTNGYAYKIPRKTKKLSKVARIKGKGYIDIITDEWGLALNLQKADGTIKKINHL